MKKKRGVKPLFSMVQCTVLIVLTHPDDEVMMSGTIAKLKAAQNKVHLLLCYENTFFEKIKQICQAFLLIYSCEESTFLKYRNLYISGCTEDIGTTGIEALHQKLTW